jgi:Rrf2 family protein
MKLSVRGEYALRALVALGRDYLEDDSVMRIQAIAKQEKIPHRFLEQILNDLKSAKIVKSKRGVAGGYRLSRPPHKITLAEIIRHVEGPLAPVSCVSENFYEKCSCPDEAKCPIRSVMKEVRDAVVRIAEQVTVADLCKRAKQLEQDAVSPLEIGRASCRERV